MSMCRTSFNFTYFSNTLNVILYSTAIISFTLFSSSSVFAYMKIGTMSRADIVHAVRATTLAIRGVRHFGALIG